MASTSSREIVHLVASLIVLTIAFTYPSLSPLMMFSSALGVGIGFLLHELAHKFTAQKYGYFADYEASPFGLVLAIGLSIFTGGGFVFAAPGAVMIRGRRVFYSPNDDRYWDSMQTMKEFAYISVSGAVVNLVIALAFIMGSFLTTPGSIAHMILMKGAFINVFLAVFNMIPFGPLDGSKVWRYNPSLWGMVAIPSIILFVIFMT